VNNERYIRIGMAQLLVEGGEAERNFERAEKLIQQGVEEKCDIILLPETLDFAWTHPRAIEECRSIPGKFSDYFCELAKKYNVWLCLGLTEKVSDKKRYNTALLINNEGEIVLKHHKINLLTVEFPYYEIGNTLNVIDSPWGKIGINICADNYIDSIDIGATLARMGAQIILSPSSWTVDYSITEEMNPYQEKWKKPLSILAKRFGLTILSTTSVGYIVGGPYEGKKSVGCSLAIGPKGIIQEGQFNEFSGELTIAEFEVFKRKEKGIEIGAFNHE